MTDELSDTDNAVLYLTRSIRKNMTAADEKNLAVIRLKEEIQRHYIAVNEDEKELRKLLSQEPWTGRPE